MRGRPALRGGARGTGEAAAWAPYSDDGTYGDYGYGIRRGGGLVPCEEGPTPGMPVWTLKLIEERLGL